MCDLSQAQVNVRGSGSKQYPPNMMLAVLIYCYATGVFSSRKIERATYESIAVRYLCANTHPDHDTIATFRRENLELFKGCFAQVLLMAREAGLLKLGTIAIDGTRMAGAGSGKSVMTLEEIDAELETLAGELCAKAEEIDRVDKDAEGTLLPDELCDAAKRREKLLAAKAQIEARRKRASDEGRRKHWQSAHHTCRASVTEPESRRLRRGDRSGFLQGSNAQLAVDAGESGLIVGMHLCDEPADNSQLQPGLRAVFAEAGPVEVVLADKGYDHAEHIAAAEDLFGVTVLCPPQERINIRVGRKRRGKEARIYALRQKMAARLKESHWAQCFKRRRTTVEGAFARIKQNLGFTRFRCWGCSAATAEWALVCLVHNVRKLTGKLATG